MIRIARSPNFPFPSTLEACAGFHHHRRPSAYSLVLNNSMLLVFSTYARPTLSNLPSSPLRFVFSSSRFVRFGNSAIVLAGNPLGFNFGKTPI
ncbi:hypothetical protein M5689_002982 [Euphorbia peplus]|nr:hypothetical protein M5689_002982 [Euphorbia peplus]